MRIVAICGKGMKSLRPAGETIETIQLDGVPVICGILNVPPLEFDQQAPENAWHVLIRVRAFSCNYRDKALIFRMSQGGGDKAYYVIGSEFMAEVVACGPEVADLQPGDRVMGNNSYPHMEHGAPPGIPGNHGSRELQRVHRGKLMKIPAAMPAADAAAFSIGAQTSYSMIRKLQVTPGANVLVTAAKSNTSLFAIQGLRKYGANVHAISTSRRFEQEVLAMGVKELIQVSPDVNHFLEHERLKEIAQETGGFDCVFDPYFDLHLGKVVPIMKMGGRYTTCGLYDQYLQMLDRRFEYKGLNLNQIMALVMTKNLSIIGNCIGLTSDLQQALADYEAGSFRPRVDSVFSGDQISAFFDRTYSSPDRFGKVVFAYD